MSDSSSSDDEGAKFREACDPTLWRTTQGSSKNGTRVEVPSDQCHGDLRHSFVLLEKIRASLASDQGVCVRPKGCPSTQERQGGRTQATTRQGTADPSTLSPFLAKHLTSRLDGSVEYKQTLEQPLTPCNSSGGDGQAPQHPLRLLSHLPLTPQASIAPTATPARKGRLARVSKRGIGLHEERLKEQCRSVAVSPDWILSGRAACPWPHPKNVRYLEKFKMKERREDGSIIAVPCSQTDNTTSTTSETQKKKKKKKKIMSVAENGETDILEQKEQLTSLENIVKGLDTNESNASQTGKRDNAFLQPAGRLAGLEGSVKKGKVCVAQPARRDSSGCLDTKKSSVVCVSQATKKDTAGIREKETVTSLQNGLNSTANTTRKRKQTRKRGKKKRVASEVVS